MELYIYIGIQNFLHFKEVVKYYVYHVNTPAASGINIQQQKDMNIQTE